MALNSLFCADVPLSNYSLTHFKVGGQVRGPKAGLGFFGRGREPPLHQLGGLRSAVSSSSGVLGEAPAANCFYRI